jgi:hypothetical protein
MIRLPGLYVVETETTNFIGSIGVTDGHLVVYSGYRGHPAIIPLEQVESITDAMTHPLVES